MITIGGGKGRVGVRMDSFTPFPLENWPVTYVADRDSYLRNRIFNHFPVLTMCFAALMYETI